MSYLLDTHILMDLVEGQTTSYPPRIQRLLEGSAAGLRVSVVSLWEIAIKSRLGKLRIGPALDSLPSMLAAIGIGLVVIDERHVLARTNPEPPTIDPFDRLLLAQCHVEGLRLITVDQSLSGHPLAA